MVYLDKIRKKAQGSPLGFLWGRLGGKLGKLLKQAFKRRINGKEN